MQAITVGRSGMSRTRYAVVDYSNFAAVGSRVVKRKTLKAERDAAYAASQSSLAGFCAFIKRRDYLVLCPPSPCWG